VLVDLAQAAPERDALCGNAEDEDRDRDPRVLERLVGAQPVDAFVDREQAAHTEQHQGDDEAPEVDRLAAAERMLRGRPALALAHAPEQQRLVRAVGERMDRLGEDRRRPGEHRACGLRDRDQEVRAEREQDRLQRIGAGGHRIIVDANERSGLEQVLDAIAPGLGVRRMPVAGLAERLIELLQELSLVLGELDRRLDADMAVEVARIARTHALDAFAAQAERLAVLRSLGQVDLGLAAERRYLDRAAERRRGHADRDGAVQVVAVTLEDLVLLDADLDVEIAVRAAVRPRLAVAARADPHAFVDAGRDLDLERLVALEAALAVARLARLGDDLAAAVARRAHLLDAEEALAHLHRSRAVAGGAVDRARSRLRAAALARLARLVRGDADLRFLAVGRFLERDLH